MIGSLKLIRGGLTPKAAVTMGITNKCFDGFEQEIVDDIVLTRIPESWSSRDVF